MSHETSDELPRRARLHAALGDPARLAIIDMLTLGEASPSELQALLEMPSNLLAHHVRTLERVGPGRAKPVGGRPETHLPVAGTACARRAPHPYHSRSGTRGVRLHRELGAIPAGRRPVERGESGARNVGWNPPRPGDPSRGSCCRTPTQLGAGTFDAAARRRGRPSRRHDHYGVRQRSRGAGGRGRRPGGCTGRSRIRRSPARTPRSTAPWMTSPTASPESRPRSSPPPETPMTETYHRADLSIDQTLALKRAATRLSGEFDGTFGKETIDRFLHSLLRGVRRPGDHPQLPSAARRAVRPAAAQGAGQDRAAGHERGAGRALPVHPQRGPLADGDGLPATPGR